MKKNELAREFLLENPKLPNRLAAKLLKQKYDAVFKDVDDARFMIRYVKGKAGKANQTKISASFLQRLEDLKTENLAPAEHLDLADFEIPKQFKKALVISDLHIPYHDLKALDIALEYGYNKSVDCVIINGDLLDFVTISKYLSKPNAPRMIESVEAGKSVLTYIKKSLGCKIFFHEGNHDKRVENYLINKAPEFWGLPIIKLENLLDKARIGFDFIINERVMNFGDLTIAHGNHIVRGVFAPVNPARGAFIKANHNILIGHCHRTSEHIESDIKGKIRGAWSIGHLTTCKPEYNPQVAKHNSGFAVVGLIDSKGNFEVDNRKIINYKVL